MRNQYDLVEGKEIKNGVIQKQWQETMFMKGKIKTKETIQTRKYHLEWRIRLKKICLHLTVNESQMKGIG